MFSSDHAATVTGKVRGVLGEDFLQNFDLLIDYRHQSIRLESPLGSMAETAAGEHLPLQLTGTYHGKPSYNRLVISGHIQEFGRRNDVAASGLRRKPAYPLPRQPWSRGKPGRPCEGRQLQSVGCFIVGDPQDPLSQPGK